MPPEPPIQGPVFLIEVNKISPNPQQPRRDFNDEQLTELAASIRQFGVLQPIVVTKVEHETPTGTDVTYQLIAGERRWRAAQLAGLARIPAVIRNVDLDRERLELAIVENLQRVDLNPIEGARAYARLQDEFKLTQREIAARIGKSREVVANTMRLLSLPTEIQDAVGKGRLSESQGRLLLTVEDIPQQKALFADLLKSNMSVRELRNRIARMKETGPQQGTTEPATAADPELMAVERELEEALGAKVRVERAGASGKITISFFSPEELHGLVERLRPNQTPPGQGESAPAPASTRLQGEDGQPFSV